MFSIFPKGESTPIAKQFALEMMFRAKIGISIPPEYTTGRKEETNMQNSIRDRIQTFLASEEGKVSVKAPLTLGMVTGSILLTQVIVGTPHAEAWPCQSDHNCYPTDRCDPDGVCRPI